MFLHEFYTKKLATKVYDLVTIFFQLVVSMFLKEKVNFEPGRWLIAGDLTSLQPFAVLYFCHLLPLINNPGLGLGSFHLPSLFLHQKLYIPFQMKSAWTGVVVHL